MIRFVLKRLAAAKPFVIPQAESSSSERKPTEDDDPQPVISSNEHNMLENDAFERGNGAIVKWVLQADPDGAEPPQENVHRRSLTPEAPSVRACNVLTLSETIAKSEEFDEWLNARISHFKSDRPLSDPLP